MKKYLILLILSVFMAFLASSCMAGMSRDGSYGDDVSYRSGYDQGHRGNHFRNRRDRNNHDDRRDRDDRNVLIIR